jgi:phosphohistidine phosphatase SixA
MVKDIKLLEKDEISCMMKKIRYMFVTCLFVILAFGLVSTKAERQINLDPASIVKELQKGGYLLYMRHGEATIGQDQPDLNFADCSTQRNLTVTGQMQARAIGEIFRGLQIPVQFPVLASPYCRTRETAELAFGKQNVAIVPFLAYIDYLHRDKITREEEQSILDKLTSIFETPLSQGSNRMVIGHSFPSEKGLGEVPYMGTVLIKPNGAGKGYEIVRRISFDEWKSWYVNR